MRKIIAGLLCLLIISTFIILPAKGEQLTTTSPKPSSWQVGNVSFTDNLRRIACFQNKLYVAVGANGTLLTSPDGEKWTKNSYVSNNINSELYDIICTESRIVVVGDKGTILTTTDGFNWVIVKPITSNIIRKVTHGNNTFLAFTDKPGEVLTSEDGITWRLGKTPLKQIVNDVSWNGKKFVTVGSDGEVGNADMSKGRLLWKTRILKPKASFYKIVWNGKMFVSVGTTSATTNEYSYTSGLYIASSKDGYSWNVKALKTIALKKDSLVTYLCNLENMIWDGKSFNIILNEQTGAYPDLGSRLVTYTSTNSINWKRNESNIGGDPITTVWTGKTYIAVCSYSFHFEYYGNIIYTSKDGVHWSSVIHEDKEGSKANDIVCANGKIIFVGDYGEIRCSSDGTTWSPNNSIHTPLLWDGKRFIAQDPATHYLYFSTDGLAWEKKNQIDYNISAGRLFQAGKEYITFGSNFISSTKDLNTWEKTEYGFDDTMYSDVGNVSAFATYGKKYVLAGSNGTAVSTDMKNWVSRKAANLYKSVVIGATGVIALNIYGQIDVSSDGLKWKRLKIDDYKNSIVKIIYADDKFVGVGNNGEVWYSMDGANWIKAPHVVSSTLNDICWTGNEFIAAGAEGTIITSKDGTEWRQEVSPLKANFISICSNGQRVIATSADSSIYKLLN